MSAYLTEFMAVIAQTASDPWAQQFANSICKKALGPDWRPSLKQRATMTYLIQDWEAGDGKVIEAVSGPSSGK